MSDTTENANEVELESGFSDDEKREVRELIDEISSENRLPAEEAVFDKKTARPGLLMPAIVNAAAIVVVVVSILVLRSVFQREEAGVQNAAIEYASIEGRLIRELRAESQEQILAKEREIETVREQLRELELEREQLDTDIEERLAEREQQLRAEIEAEIEVERARLIAEGLENDEIDRLMQEFEAEREAFYAEQIAQFRAELDEERLALESEIDNLRTEYQSRLTQLEEQRQEILEEFQAREEDLRVELEQRTRVLEVARVTATEDLEAAQRELADLSREQENVDAIQNQIIGQIEDIQGSIVSGDNGVALALIDSLTSFLNEDQVLEIESLTRRRETDLFLLRQLRTLVLADTEVASDSDRSITQELRLISQIRRLSDEAQGASDLTSARETFEVLLETLPEVSEAHQQVVEQEREEAVEEIRTTEREIVQSGTASASTLAAAGEYQAALDEYVEALDQLPSTAPDSGQIVSDILRLGYAMTDYVIYGRSADEARDIAGRTTVNLDDQRAAYLAQEEAIRAAFQVQVDALDLRIAELNDEIVQLETDLSVARNETPDEIPGIALVPEEEFATLQQERSDLQAQVATLRVESTGRASELLLLNTQFESLQVDLDRAEDERDALQTERERLVTAYDLYRERQDQAIVRSADGEVNLAQTDTAAIVNARTEFLGSTVVSDLMPDFLSVIDQFDQLRTQESLQTGLGGDVIADVLGTLAISSEAQRERYLVAEYSFAVEDGDATLADFLSGLADVLGIPLDE